MSEFNNTYNIVANFVFKKGDYLGAEEQFSRFADSYVKLSIEEAQLLRSKFKAKDRLGWLQVFLTIFCKFFSDADISHKNRLCKIFFALYSFDNLGVGYDSVNCVILISGELKKHTELARRNWDLFSKLTSNDLAVGNLENKIF